MKISIVGATGNMGSALTKNLARAGHEIYAYAPNSEKLAELVATVKKEVPGARVVASSNSSEAAQVAEVIIPAVWYPKQQEEVAEAISAAAKGKIVVNIANPFNETFDGLLTPPDTSAAEEFAKLLPGSTVIKAFNTALAADFAHPEFKGVRADVFLAGDDEKAAEVVSQIVKDAGFNPIYVGDLSRSRTLEQMMVLLVSASQRYNYNWLAGWKILHE